MSAGGSDERKDAGRHVLTVGYLPHERTPASQGEAELADRDNGRASPTILIVDDSLTFRKQLRVLLEMEGFQVVGEAGNGWEAIELCARLEPDIVLMDQNMPALTGIAATRRILESQPGVRVIFIAAEEAWREEALKSGAEAYFVKDDSMAEVLNVIRDPRSAIFGHGPRSAWNTAMAFIKKLLWPVIGSLLGVALLTLFDVLPSVLLSTSALLASLLSIIGHLY